MSEKRKIDYNMMSMDFEEFLWAKGYDRVAIEDMLWHMKAEKPFNEIDMKVYSALFLDYCILGGMPAVVRAYISKGTFEGTLDIQRQLLNDYREDIRKYAEGMDQTRILNVFEQIPIQLAKDNKKFYDTYSIIKIKCHKNVLYFIDTRDFGHIVGNLSNKMDIFSIYHFVYKHLYENVNVAR